MNLNYEMPKRNKFLCEINNMESVIRLNENVQAKVNMGANFFEALDREREKREGK